MEDEQVEDEPPNLELGFAALAPPKDLSQDIPPHHSNQVRSIPAHLLDYHYYTAFATLHKLHTYCHAPNPIPRFVTMTGILISSLNLILTRTNLTFNKTFTEAFLFL